MLFTERAAAASGSFELTAANQAAVVGLCRRLDGLPLAIELAAVRTRVLAAEQILDRLTDRFGLLTGGSRAALPRHQTLRTAIEWSYDLLPDGERAVLRRLCVFAGRFTLEDIESVCCSGEVPAARALDLAVLAGRQVAGDEGGRRRPGLLPAARDDARIRAAQAARGRGGRRRRAALRRVLPVEVCSTLCSKAGTGCLSGSRGRTWRSTTSGRSSGAAWTAPTRGPASTCRLPGLVLDHARDS